MRALVVQNVELEGPGLLRQVMEEAGWELDVRVMDRPGSELPRDLGGYGALVILGGPMNVYEEEEYPHLKQVEILIRDALDRNLPSLGICLGGQLMAKALGAPVTRNPVQEIGWYNLILTPQGQESPLFRGLPAEFPVFQWHGDTFAIPAGAAHLAACPTCANQAFSYKSLFALQFHPEITPEMVASWARAYADELEEFGGPGAAERLVEETVSRWEAYGKAAGRLLANWVGILRGMAEGDQ